MKQDSMIQDLTVGPVGRQLLKFSLPFVLSQALQTVYNLVDTVIVGHYLGAGGLSAVSNGGLLLWTLSALSVGYASGGQIYISQQVGSGDREHLRKTIGTLFTAVFLLGLAFSVFGVFAGDGLLQLLSTPAEALGEAENYVFICSVGLLFVYGYNVVSAVLRGMGDSTRPFIFIAVAALLNVVLDLVFVGALGLGAGGAALATVASQGVSFVAALVYLIVKREQFGFDFKRRSFRIDGKTLRAMSVLSLPMAFQNVAINVSILFIASFVNAYGLVFSAVYGIGCKLNNIIFIVTMSLNAAGSTMIGQNFGAGKLDRVKKIVHMEDLICYVFFVLISIPSLIWPKAIFRAFTDDPAVIAEAARYMVVEVVLCLSFVSMQSTMSVVSGIGNGALFLIIAIADGVVARIGLSLLLAIPCGMGVWGYFWGNALSAFVSTICGWIYYYSGRWEKRRLLVTGKQ